MNIDVRTITDDEVTAWCAALNTGFHNAKGAVDAEARRPGLFLDRTWGAFDGDHIVGTLRSFPTTMTVPGGELIAASGVTAVTTTATHRRRGVASRMVHADIAASKERGELASVLIAAEWGIYGRFGFGAATEQQTWTVNALLGRVRHHAPGSVAFVDRETARAVAPLIHGAHQPTRPGQLSQSDRFWDINFDIIHYESWSPAIPSLYIVATDTNGAPIGMAMYNFEEKGDFFLPSGQINVTMFVTSDPAADVLLWRHLLSLDLVATIRIESRPADDLLPWLLVDARHAHTTERGDFLWVRPLDVATLLSNRRYDVSGRIVLDVVDRSGLSGGRFALDAGVDGASCVPTGTSADLTLDIGVLGSLYLGGHSVRTLAAAGLIDEHSPDAVARADSIFRASPAPWCSVWF